MNKSDSIKDLAAALSKAQKVMGAASKDAANPFFKSHYSTLASVVDAIREPMTSNGLSFVQLTQPSEKHEVIIETVLMHESGEWISSVTVIPVSKHDAQGFGSAMTYAKRYGLQAIAGVPSDDDDGNAAAAAAPKAQAPKPAPTPMPAKVKEAVKPKAKGTVTGNADEGDLTGIGEPAGDAFVDKVTQGKIINGFANINFTLPQLEQEFGKGMDQWLVSDVPYLRQLLADMKADAAAARQQTADMAQPDAGIVL